MSENLFEVASRNRWRFQSAVGPLTVEDLWSLPLDVTEAKTPRASLNGVAVTLHTSIDANVSFVRESSPANAEALKKLELVKLIIAQKKQELVDAALASKRREERQVLLELKQTRQLESLKSLTDEELDKRLAELTV